MGRAGHKDKKVHLVKKRQKQGERRFERMAEPGQTGRDGKLKKDL